MGEIESEVLLVYSKKIDCSILNCAKDFGKMFEVKIEPAFNFKKDRNALLKLIESEECTKCIYFDITKRFNRIWFATQEVSYKFEITTAHSVFDMSTVQNYCCNSGFELILEGDMDEKFKNALKRLFVSNSEKKERAIVMFKETNNLHISHFRLDNKEEIGPRMVLKLEKVFEGFFSGEVTKIKAESS